MAAQERISRRSMTPDEELAFDELAVAALRLQVAQARADADHEKKQAAKTHQQEAVPAT